MDAFTTLLDRLYYTHSTRAKAALLCDYFAHVPDPDRGYAVAALAGDLSFKQLKRAGIISLIKGRVDPVLYDLSRDYVGETSETVAHIWPVDPNAPRLNRLPPLHEVVERFRGDNKQAILDYVALLLDNMTAEQRWALIKLATGGLRVGVSARFIKKVLAEYGGRDVSEVEGVWHGLTPPYASLFAWLEGTEDRPDVSDSVTYHPVMLSHPLADTEVPRILRGNYAAEWKYDGIRVQLVSTPRGVALFSRTGDDISHSFPDLLEGIDFHAVLDGELLVSKDGVIAPFNALQQRLNKKKPSKKLMTEHPVFLMLYDVLIVGDDDVRDQSLTQRRAVLEHWVAEHPSQRRALSPHLSYNTEAELQAYRAQANRQEDNYIEGLMLKNCDSPYIAGRPKGHWYKWKRDPLLIDAVLMYAQRGSGKRSSFYSDYTFGLWKGDQLLPIGKAYSGFTDAELKKLDGWIRKHTLKRFGPVREVEKAMVFEVAFDSVHPSPRHKSGLALRFPRIHRIRWDKPAAEADIMDSLAALVQPG